MPELAFNITAAAPVAHGLSPIVEFSLRIQCRQAAETVQALILQSQVQIQPAHRSYSSSEKGQLLELFGPPSDWGRTLRNRLWAQVSVNVGAFVGETKTRILVPCTYDLNVAASKYCYGLESGEVPLLFLFSGSVFYLGEDGRLQVQPIAWDQEAEYRMPVALWRQALDCHFPDTAWISLRKDVFDRFASYKSASGTGTWDQAVESLLDEATKNVAPEVNA